MSDANPERQVALGAAPLLSMRGLGRIEPVPPACRFLYRGADAAALCSASFGVTLPQVACRAAVVGSRAALWLGPDEWLLIAPEQERGTLLAEMTGALATNAHSLVDVSHRQTAIQLTGPRVSQLINAGCPLDLELASFPVDMCGRTIFAKAEIILWRQAKDVFRIEVWRSFASYVVALLSEASLSATNP
jgi:sarcosine oxidase subunit gamma